MIKVMRSFSLAICLICAFSVSAEGSANREIEAEMQVVTKHKTTINGQRINYSATAGTQLTMMTMVYLLVDRLAQFGSQSLKYFNPYQRVTSIIKFGRPNRYT